MKLSDNPTIVGIVGVLFMEDAVAATSTFIALGVVPAALLLLASVASCPYFDYRHFTP
jgi:hypothetical protein